jgi:hypothetical protein
MARMQLTMHNGAASADAVGLHVGRHLRPYAE